MAKPARSVDTTVRVDRATSSAIAYLARETGVARKEVVALAVERLRRHRILESANEGFAAMKRDAGVWREEVDERGSWESTLADGLSDE
jgi:hypothetical protein